MQDFLDPSSSFAESRDGLLVNGFLCSQTPYKFHRMESNLLAAAEAQTRSRLIKEWSDRRTRVHSADMTPDGLSNPD